ncbi:MAG: alpha/beta fold hydrolase BchO [Pseudomonadota bacterium]
MNPEPALQESELRQPGSVPTSRFFEIDGVRLHVQVTGSGPALLCVHGTGAATPTWRLLLPELSRHRTIIAPDLPGHGLSSTAAPAATTPAAVARLLAKLLDALELQAGAAMGHSAGAVVIAQMQLDQLLDADRLIFLNPAMLTPLGAHWGSFRMLAGLLANSTLVTTAVAGLASDQNTVTRLLAGIGTHLDGEGQSAYRRLFSDPAHVTGTLKLMASWKLETLASRLSELDGDVLVISGARDVAVPQREINRLRIRLPQARYVELAEVGHLAHEEAPERVLELILPVL